MAALTPYPICCNFNAVDMPLQTTPPTQLEDEIHIRYGHSLFGKGEYDEGLAQLGMSSSSNPVTLLLLFPSLASPSLLQPISHLTPGNESTFCHCRSTGSPCMLLVGAAT